MDEIDLEKVQYLLLMHEQWLVTQNVPHLTTAFDSPMSSSMSVNVASYSSQNGNGSVTNTRGGYNNRRGHYGTRGGRLAGKRIYCQLCEKLGHFVDKCYHIFDKNFHQSSGSNFGRGSSVGYFNFRDSQAYLAFVWDSSEGYMTDLGSYHGIAYGTTPQPSEPSFLPYD